MKIPVIFFSAIMLIILVFAILLIPYNKNAINIETPNREVMGFNLEGHDYIRFSENENFSVVHNPDCRKCNAINQVLMNNSPKQISIESKPFPIKKNDATN